MGDSPIRGAALLRLWRDKQGLELVSLQGRLGGGGDQGEVGHQGGGLVQGIVLAEGDEVDVFSGQQGPDGGGGGGQPVVGGGGDEQGAAVAQMGLGGHGHAGVGDPGGQLAQSVARAGAEDEQVQQN